MPTGADENLNFHLTAEFRLKHKKQRFSRISCSCLKNMIAAFKLWFHNFSHMHITALVKFALVYLTHQIESICLTRFWHDWLDKWHDMTIQRRLLSLLCCNGNTRSSLRLQCRQAGEQGGNVCDKSADTVDNRPCDPYSFQPVPRLINSLLAPSRELTA